MRRAVLLVNPAAGDSTALAAARIAARDLAAWADVRIVETPSAAALEDAARRACADAHAVIVAGGDGTVQAAANALAGSSTSLGILPTGTGNDFARGLGLPADLAAATARIAQGRVRAVDLAAVNARLFCTVGGIGLIARTTRTVARLGASRSPVGMLVRRAASQAYLGVAAFQILARAVTDDVTIEATGPDGPLAWSGRCHAVLVASQATLGAGLSVPVASSDRDGVGELCIVPARHRLSLARYLVALRTGAPVPASVLRVHRITRALIRCASRVPCSADGEMFADGETFEVDVRPAALQVLA